MIALAFTPAFHELPTYRVQSAAASSLSYRLSGILADITQHARANATDWRPLTKALIEQVAQQCQSANWDGYGAHPISSNAKNQAQRFIDMMPFRIPAPEPMPDPDGDMALLWDFGPGHVFTLSISPNGTLSYAGLLGEGVKRHGMEPFKGTIPKTIVEYIQELCEKASARS